MGERQVLPVHTKQTVSGFPFSVSFLSILVFSSVCISVTELSA